MYQDMKQRLFTAMNGVGPSYALIAKRFGLTLSTMLTVYLVEEQPGITQTQICETLGYPKSTVHSILRDLQVKNYAVLAIGENRRERNITLTLEGQQAFEGVLAELRRSENRIFRALGEEKCAQLVELVDQIGNLIRQESERLEKEN